MRHLAKLFNILGKMKEEAYLLPVVPENTKAKVITHFWWDNFDIKKEKKRGGHHTTHGMAFQEKVKGETKGRDRELSVEPLDKILKISQTEK